MSQKMCYLQKANRLTKDIQASSAAIEVQMKYLKVLKRDLASYLWAIAKQFAYVCVYMSMGRHPQIPGMKFPCFLAFSCFSDYYLISQIDVLCYLEIYFTVQVCC